MKKIILVSAFIHLFNISALGEEDFSSKDQLTLTIENEENREDEMFSQMGVLFPGDLEDEDLP